MRSWGIQQRCFLCGEPDETRDHLFFICPYSFTVWSDVTGSLLGKCLTLDWLDTLSAIAAMANQHQRHILIHLAFQATMYWVWKEQNDCIVTFSHSGLHLVKLISKQIRITSSHYDIGNHLERMVSSNSGLSTLVHNFVSHSFTLVSPIFLWL